MVEFNNLRSYHDKAKNAHLNVRETNVEGLYFEIHQIIGEKYCSLVLTKEDALNLSNFISEYYKQ
jgi:hypothetical protein